MFQLHWAFLSRVSGQVSAFSDCRFKIKKHKNVKYQTRTFKFEKKEKFYIQEKNQKEHSLITKQGY